MTSLGTGSPNDRRLLEILISEGNKGPAKWNEGVEHIVRTMAHFPQTRRTVNFAQPSGRGRKMGGLARLFVSSTIGQAKAQQNVVEGIMSAAQKTVDSPPNPGDTGPRRLNDAIIAQGRLDNARRALGRADQRVIAAKDVGRRLNKLLRSGNIPKGLIALALLLLPGLVASGELTEE